MFLDYSGVINSANSLNTEIFNERRLLRKIRLCLSDRAQRLCLSDRQRYVIHQNVQKTVCGGNQVKCGDGSRVENGILDPNMREGS